MIGAKLSVKCERRKNPKTASNDAEEIKQQRWIFADIINLSTERHRKASSLYHVDNTQEVCEEVSRP